jgi:hypothetical protein
MRGMRGSGSWSKRRWRAGAISLLAMALGGCGSVERTTVDAAEITAHAPSGDWVTAKHDVLVPAIGENELVFLRLLGDPARGSETNAEFEAIFTNSACAAGCTWADVDGFLRGEPDKLNETRGTYATDGDFVTFRLETTVADAPGLTARIASDDATTALHLDPVDRAHPAQDGEAAIFRFAGDLVPGTVVR